MTTKKGHDYTTEKSVYVMPYLDGQCSHPEYVGGYKLFSGLLY